jgi:NAD(P)-dependent dehydrogenase (short-subunit alcohol dehydrogenase family)
MDITGKTALVTGSAGGIGRATAVALAAKGAERVILADVDEGGLAETAKLVEKNGAQAVVVPTDVTNLDSIRNLFAKADEVAGGIDILHNNAGLVTSVPQYPDMPLERVAALCDVNLKAVTLGTTLGIPLLRKRGGGTIVNTSSIAAHAPALNEAIYNTTKAAVVFFTHCCAELKDSDNIRVNCVCPGITDTPILNKTGDGTKPAEWLAPFLGMVKLISAEEIANVVIGFIEDDSKNDEIVTVENELTEEGIKAMQEQGLTS